MNGPDNPIGWCDYTWNPVTGCLHDCKFGPNKTPCYAEAIAKRFAGSPAFPDGFRPKFHPKRLGQPGKVKDPARIFVSSMGDLFGSWVPDEWIAAVLETAVSCPQHDFLFVTKNPWRYKKISFPANAWVGTTITGALSKERQRMEIIRDLDATVRFLSVEPLEKPVDLSPAAPDWVILGQATGGGAVAPEESWVVNIENDCRKTRTPLYHKDNLKCRTGRRLKQFPIR